MVLDDFEVERDVATQNPAGFKSRVRFIDPKKGSSLQREIWMNHPADYPAGILAGIKVARAIIRHPGRARLENKSISVPNVH
jgi:hypothetical protein